MLKKILNQALESENYLVIFIIPIFRIVLTNLIQEDTGYWTQFWWMFPVGLVIAIFANTVGISGAALLSHFLPLYFQPLLLD